MIRSMTRELRLTCVRHGETDLNRQRRIQGHMDCPLSEHGEKQARALGRHFQQQQFHYWYAMLADLCSNVFQAIQ